MSFHLAPDLDLPDRFATEGVVVIGVRGSGKSNTEVRFAELLFGAGVPFAAIDPKGDWYGIRMDGEQPGLPVPVFGGLYGDFPLDESLGAKIANLLVDENMSAVLDVSRLSHAARARFLTDFFHQLMERHQLEPHARCVIFEEAHRYIPQNVPAKLTALKEAAASILLEGRSFGLGCWACTQRPARLHNDVLEEVDTAIIHRIGVTATADLERVRKWVKHEDLGNEIGASLTKLKAGEAWVLSPVSLGLVVRSQIDRRKTFDSGATPVVGDASVVKRRQSTMADIDAGAIKEALADAIEKAKATDPAELTKRVRDLERELVTARKVQPAPEPVIERVEVPVLDQQIVTDLAGVLDRFETTVVTALQEVSGSIGRAHEALAAIVATQRSSERTVRRTEPVARSPKPQAASPPRRDAPVTSMPSGDLPVGEHKILIAVAQHTDGVTKEQLTILTGYKRSSRDTYLQRLRSRDAIDMGGGRITATDVGLALLGADFEPLPTGAALRDHWLVSLPEGERRILGLLVDAYPDGVPREEISDRTGYKRSSRDTYLQRLRARALITTDGDPRAADTLFD